MTFKHFFLVYKLISPFWSLRIPQTSCSAVGWVYVSGEKLSKPRQLHRLYSRSFVGPEIEPVGGNQFKSTPLDNVQNSTTEYTGYRMTETLGKPLNNKRRWRAVLFVVVGSARGLDFGEPQSVSAHTSWHQTPPMYTSIYDKRKWH